MKHYCSVCHKIHEGKCARPRYENKLRNSEADKFRNTQVWRRKSAAILERDYHCCRMCAQAGVINSYDLSVHHIIPLVANYDKRLDDDNLITLCRYHHEQAERGKVRKSELAKILQNADVFHKVIPPYLRPSTSSEA